MFGFLKKAPPPAPVMKVPKIAPENPYLGREPIINREHAIIGYELFFRPGVTIKAQRINERNAMLVQIEKTLAADPKAVVIYPEEITDANLRDDQGKEIKEATLTEILHSLKTQGVAQSIGQHMGFIRIHVDQLGDELRGVPSFKFPLQIDLAEILEAIKEEKLALAMAAAEAARQEQDQAGQESEEEGEAEEEEEDEDEEGDEEDEEEEEGEHKLPAVLDKIERFRRRGFRFALTGLNERVPGLEDILLRFKYVKLNLHETKDPEDLIAYCKSIQLPKENKVVSKKGVIANNGLQIIATDVHLPEEYRRAFNLGCDAFEGFYFIKKDPELSMHRGEEFIKILELLTLLLSGPELNELVDAIEANPVVAKHLMVIAEIDSRGKRAKPQNIRDAATIAGVKRITRWTQLLLYADTSGKVALDASPLLQLVCNRAFFMESMASKLPAGGGLGSSDLAFLVGGLSLVDNIFDQSSRELLSKLNLPSIVVDAISDRTGLLGELLALSEAAEVGDLEKCQQLCADGLKTVTLGDIGKDSLTAIKTFVAQTQLAPEQDVWEQAESYKDAAESEQAKESKPLPASKPGKKKGKGRGFEYVPK